MMNRLLTGAFGALVMTRLVAADFGSGPPGSELEGEFLFADVIKRTTGQEIIAFDSTNATHAALLKRLTEAAAVASRAARAANIASARANEVGNAIEAHVLDALNSTGLKAHRPRTTAGRTQAAGYPDVEIDSEPPCYLELKTYNARTAESSQRTFYYSPSRETKVTRPALHLLLAFEIEQRADGNHVVWAPVRFRLVSLHDLRVQLKVEYNQSNRGLYAAERLLADEPVE